MRVEPAAAARQFRLGTNLGANLVVSRAGLRGMKGVPRDDTGSGESDLARRYIVASLRSQLRRAGNRAWSRFGFLQLGATFSRYPITRPKAIDLIPFRVSGSQSGKYLERNIYVLIDIDIMECFHVFFFNTFNDNLVLIIKNDECDQDYYVGSISSRTERETICVYIYI